MRSINYTREKVRTSSKFSCADLYYSHLAFKTYFYVFENMAVLFTKQMEFGDLSALVCNICERTDHWDIAVILLIFYHLEIYSLYTL
jgi:hypothetical protein